MRAGLGHPEHGPARSGLSENAPRGRASSTVRCAVATCRVHCVLLAISREPAASLVLRVPMAVETRPAGAPPAPWGLGGDAIAPDLAGWPPSVHRAACSRPPCPNPHGHWADRGPGHSQCRLLGAECKSGPSGGLGVVFNVDGASVWEDAQSWRWMPTA